MKVERFIREREGDWHELDELLRAPASRPAQRAMLARIASPREISGSGRRAAEGPSGVVTWFSL
jgi:Rad3-related DNA helicase